MLDWDMKHGLLGLLLLANRREDDLSCNPVSRGTTQDYSHALTRRKSFLLSRSF